MIEQIWLFVLSSACTFLSHDTKHNWRRWAPVVGLAAQPAWYYSTWIAAQWGVLALTMIITYCHVRGLWLLWWVPAKAQRKALNAAISKGLSEHIRTHKRQPGRLSWQEREMEREFGSRH